MNAIQPPHILANADGGQEDALGVHNIVILLVQLGERHVRLTRWGENDADQLAAATESGNGLLDHGWHHGIAARERDCRAPRGSDGSEPLRRAVKLFIDIDACNAETHTSKGFRSCTWIAASLYDEGG